MTKDTAPSGTKPRRSDDEVAVKSPLGLVESNPSHPDVPVWDLRGLMVRRFSVTVDMFALLVVGALTVLLLKIADRPVLPGDVALFLVFTLLWPVVGVAMRAYHPHSVGRGLTLTAADEFLAIVGTATIWSWCLLVARSISHQGQITQLLPSLMIWVLAIFSVLLARSLLRRFARRRGWYQQQVLLIGRQSDSEKVSSRIGRHPEWGLTMAGKIDVDVSGGDSAGETVDGETLLAASRDLEVSRVIFASPPEQLNANTDLTRAFIESGVQVDFVPGEAEILRSGAEISDIEGLPLISMPGARPPRSRGILKRGIDICVAVPALTLVSPLLAFAALRIRFSSPGGVLYRQPRAGLNGRPFELLKLRTMVSDADTAPGGYNNLTKTQDDPRVTKVGFWLRRRSIDELPQLWNVIKGEMSLVGPRPLPLDQDDQVAHRYELRRHVRPGMTGLWQVNGRSDIPFHDMLRLDYSYVLNWSLALDIKLMTQTIAAVLGGRGAY